MPIIRRFTLLLLLLPLLFTLGCVTATKVRPLNAWQLTPEHRQQVISMTERGDYAGAAKLLESFAAQSGPPLWDRLILEAAENWLKVGDQERSLSLVKQLLPLESDPDFTLKLRLVKTELAIQQGDIEQALDLMQLEPAPDAPLELRQHYHRNMAEIFRLSGNLLESARELDVLDKLQEDDIEQRLATQQLLVQTLSTMTDTTLTLLQPQPPATLIGWMELAKVIKLQISDPTKLSSRLAQWQERFPNHPALQTLLASYMEQRGLSQDDHIAILLPRNGPYVQVAAAVRDGFMAAWYQQPAESRPKLQFYDSGSQQDILTIYQQAVLSGAKMIVGPLDKDAVKMLAHMKLLDIPVLALNQIDDEINPVNPNLYQFGLAPEDEAEQVAERAWLEGHRTALILTPSGDWGERLASSFRNRWQDLGGKAIEQQSYNPNENDFSVPIRSLLNVNESKERIQAVTRLLGRKLKAEPRTRQDADFIFLAARPQKARQLRPQLKFFRAGDMPILATSHIYSGVTQPDLDRDLGKISFVDMPWLLEESQEDSLSRKQLEKLIPGVRGRYARLYAMGIDSYNLLPFLPSLQAQPGRLFNGKSGALYLDNQNKIHRLLAWADMERGLAHISGYAPRIGTPTPYQPSSLQNQQMEIRSHRSGLPPVSEDTLSQPGNLR
ncbi:MAG: penicillin-binding protein activator [Candidatus Thiodiazotropha sp.]|jgi:uncharacterized protein